MGFVSSSAFSILPRENGKTFQSMSIKPTDPIKEGYIFIEWQHNGLKYNFDTPIETDLELIAIYEEVKTVTKPSTNTNANNKTTNNNSNNASIVTKVAIPTLTANGKGGSLESWGISYTVTNVDVADGIEIYKSTTGSDYQLENTLTITQLAQQNNEIGTIAYIGEHNYYKVRAYKTVNGNKVYSDYSKVVEVTGPEN